MSRREQMAHLRRRRTARRRRHFVMAGVSVVLAAPYLVHLRALPDPAAHRDAPAAEVRQSEPEAAETRRILLPFVPLASGTFVVEPDVIGADGAVIARLPHLRLRVRLRAGSGPDVNGGDKPRGRRR